MPARRHRRRQPHPDGARRDGRHGEHEPRVILNTPLPDGEIPRADERQPHDALGKKPGARHRDGLARERDG